MSLASHYREQQVGQLVPAKQVGLELFTQYLA